MCYTVECEGVCQYGHIAAAYAAVEGCSASRARDPTCAGRILLGILRCTIPVSHCEICCVIASLRQTTQYLAESCEERMEELFSSKPRPGRAALPLVEWIKYVKPYDGLLR